MAKTQRNQEIATSFSLWGEYVDPDATMSEEEFNALGIDERLKLMAEAFPEEAGEDDSSLFSPRNIERRVSCRASTSTTGRGKRGY